MNIPFKYIVLTHTHIQTYTHTITSLREKDWWSVLLCGISVAMDYLENKQQFTS